MSRGYEPRSTGSRNQRLRWPSNRAAAATSATESDAACTGARLSVIPTRASGPPPARSARTASPCESSRWCETRRAVTQSRMPGALTPSACPRKATTHGSLWVIHCVTTSPSRSAISAAYSAKRSAVSRTAQPPASCRADGRSQW